MSQAELKFAWKLAKWGLILAVFFFVVVPLIAGVTGWAIGEEVSS